MEAAHWEAALSEKGPKVLALFESQLRAYDDVLDFATQRVPIAEAWIRKLHSEICRSQETYQVWTEIGPQEQVLPKGEYKHLPNHVLGADGELHSYAPVDMTPPEMYRLCEELRSEAFLTAHPVLQASYAHYALVVIHPFADGNGRVARAMASVFTYRSQSVPLLILVDTRKDYYESLASADRGDYQQFVDFVLERSLDAISLVNESLRAAASPEIESSLAALKGLYMTKGGYTQAEVDEAGYKFFDLFQIELTQRAQEAAIKDVLSVEGHYPGRSHTLAKPKYRLPLTKPPRDWVITFTSSPPAKVQVFRSFALEIPEDCAQDDDLIIHNLQTHELFKVRISELFPVATAALHMRISIWVEAVIGEALAELSRAANELLKKQGQ
ncbi:MAG: Fic family protein [Blastocatellia bacterium]|nr:Fic family protein [Blastocatellia bacterium]